MLASIFGHAACAQTVNIIYVQWNSSDATANINAAITQARNQGGPSKLIFTRQTTPWIINDTIVLDVDDMQLWFANAGTSNVPFVQAKSNGSFGTGDPLFRVRGTNVRINGYHNGLDASGGVAILEMQKAQYIALNDGGQSRHCINVSGAANTTIQGLILRKSGGDGIAINPKASSGADSFIPASNVIITDVTCDENYRQGISVISVDTLTATNCVFKNTGVNGAFSLGPNAGLDIEPSRYYDKLKAVKFVGCTFSGNVGNNIEINLDIMEGTGLDAIDLRFESCIIQGGAKAGMRFTHLEPTGPTGTVVVKNTTITGTTKSGIIFYDWKADRAPVTMANVDIVNCSENDDPPLLWTQTPNDVQHGDVIFQSGCHIHEDFTRTNALVYVGGTIQSGYGVKDITGTIDYHRPANSTGPIMVLGTNTVNCTLTVTAAP